MRPFLTSALFLLAGAVSGFAAVDTSLLALLPAGTKIVSGVNADRARTSPLGQYMLNRMNSDSQGLDQMINETGFDPRKDLQDVIFASAGPDGNKAGGNMANSQFVVLVRGNFDQNRIRTAIQSRGVSVSNYGGVDIFIDKTKGGRTVFAFPQVDIAVLGDRQSVEQVIQNRANPAVLDAALQQLISSVGGSNDAWFASLVSGHNWADGFNMRGTPGAAGQRMQPEALQSILQSSGGMVFGSMVQLSFDAVMRSAKDATSLEDVIRFMASMAQSQGQANAHMQALGSALDNMSVKADGNSVHISLALPEKNVEQFVEGATSH